MIIKDKSIISRNECKRLKSECEGKNVTFKPKVCKDYINKQTL